MEMSIGFNFITGMMVGFEYVQVEDVNYIVLDFLFFRITLEFVSDS